MNSLQRKVDEFCKLHDLYCGLEVRFLDLVSELGELAKEIIKSTDYGRKEFRFKEEIKEEIGDLFFSLLVLANQLNVDLEETLDLVLEKHEKRIKERNTPSSEQN